MAYLMLKAWDIGGGSADHSKLPDPRSTAWTCSLITLGIAIAPSPCSGSSPTSSAGCSSPGRRCCRWCSTACSGWTTSSREPSLLLVVIAGLVLTLRKQPRHDAGGAEMSSLLALVLLMAATDPAAPAPDDGKLPASVEKLFEEKGKDGKPILGDTERAYSEEAAAAHPRAHREGRGCGHPGRSGAPQGPPLPGAVLPGGGDRLLRQLHPLPRRSRVAEEDPSLLRRSQGHPVERALEPQELRERRALPPRALLRGVPWGLSGQGRDDPGHRRPLAQGRRAPRGPHLDPGVLRPVPRRPQLHAGLQPFPPHRPARQVPRQPARHPPACRRRTPRRRSA